VWERFLRAKVKRSFLVGMVILDAVAACRAAARQMEFRKEDGAMGWTFTQCDANQRIVKCE
jgi:hypothetical protein